MLLQRRALEAWLVVGPADGDSKGRMEDHARPLLHAKNLENWGTAQHLKWEHASATACP